MSETLSEVFASSSPFHIPDEDISINPNAKIDVEFTFAEIEGRYFFTVTDLAYQEQVCRDKTSLTPTSLHNHYVDLAESLEQMFELDAPERASRLKNLGVSLLTQAFGGARNAKTVARYLKEKIYKLACRGERPLHIKIRSEDFQFPFGFLYLGSIDESFDINKFLGASAVLVREYRSSLKETDERFLELVHLPWRMQGPRLCIGLAYQELMYVCRWEVPHLTKCLERKKDQFNVRVFNFPTVRSGTPRDRVELKLRHLLRRRKFDFLHVACHGVNDNSPQRRHIVVKENFKLYADAFPDDFRFASAPIVFLNACDMAQVSPAAVQATSVYLLTHGASCIITPEIKVRDKSAALFALSFYAEFFVRGRPLSHAFLGAVRRRLEAGDFSSLAYALGGKPDFQIVASSV